MYNAAVVHGFLEQTTLVTVLHLTTHARTYDGGGVVALNPYAMGGAAEVLISLSPNACLASFWYDILTPMLLIRV